MKMFAERGGSSVLEAESISGHRRPIQMLKRAGESGRVAHAYVFHGPEGVGKEKVAFWFAKLLNCTSPDEQADPCYRCENCMRIEKMTHPDVRLVAPEHTLVERGIVQPQGRRQPSDQIRAGQIEELADLFRHKPYQGKWKVVVVIESDRMNLHCQNRFLKTLEEPNQASLIILVSSHPASLLPTVWSRCQGLSFGPLDKHRLMRYLSEQLDVQPQAAEVLASMSYGSVDRAVDLYNADILEARDRMAQALGAVPKSDMAELLENAKTLGQSRQEVECSLDLMEMWLRDVLFIKTEVGAELVLNHDRLDWMNAQARNFDATQLLVLIDRIRESRKTLKVYANPQMIMESVLLAVRQS